MKVLITGSRKCSPAMRSKVKEVVEWVARKGYSLILGGAVGVDEVAEGWASKLGVPVRVIMGSPGYYLARNRQMVEEAQMIVAIWDGCSFGTKYTFEYARSKGKRVEVRQF